MPQVAGLYPGPRRAALVRREHRQHFLLRVRISLKFALSELSSSPHLAGLVGNNELKMGDADGSSTYLARLLRHGDRCEMSCPKLE